MYNGGCTNIELICMRYGWLGNHDVVEYVRCKVKVLSLAALPREWHLENFSRIYMNETLLGSIEHPLHHLADKLPLLASGWLHQYNILDSFEASVT